MPNDDSQTPHSTTRDLSNPSEEEDLWELDEDWDEDKKKSPLSPRQESSDATPAPSPEVEDKATKARELFKPTTAPKVQDPEPSETPASPAPREAEQKTEEAQGKEKPTTAIRLSMLEKISLGFFTIALLGLGIYGYIWLYNKNLKEDDSAVKLPVQGQYITIFEFSTHWTAAKNNADAKMGSRILPAVHLSLPAENSASGALRFHFRNKEDNIVGDPVTIAIRDGKITNSSKPSIQVENDGASVTIIASDGFQLEGDFGAYLLDPKLAWKVHVFEADSVSAPGHTFKENKLIATKLSPERK